MKNLKFIFLSIVIALFTLTSCENNEPILEIETPSQSASAKTAMSELRTHFDENGQLRPPNNPTQNILFDYCFDFVYPVTLSYNTGATVAVNDISNLIDILVQMTDVLYIDGIVFPFDVEVYDDATASVVTQTIIDEDAFETLIDSCEFDQQDSCICTSDYSPVCVEIQDASGSFIVEFPNMCYAICEGFTQQDLVDCGTSTNPGTGTDDCFEFNFPISLIGNDGVTITVNDETELETILYASNGFYDFVYPFNITIDSDGTTQTITNGADFFQVMSDCYDTDLCVCPTVYDPVCVLMTTPNGDWTAEFPNMCEAECAGFTAADIVDCTSNNHDDCIEDLTVTLGDCSDDTHYAITVDFTTNDFDGNFSLYYRNDVLLATGSMSDLPLTLTVELSGFNEDYLKVVLENTTVPCSVETEWDAPNCDTSSNQCWEFVYPVTFNQAGSTVTVTDETEFNAQYNAANSTLIYPFNVTLDGQSITINTPNDFYTIGEFANMCD